MTGTWLDTRHESEAFQQGASTIHRPHCGGGRSSRDAGSEVVVEEFLDGEEASYFALVDGETCLELASAQDHKAVGDGDTGAPARPPRRRLRERDDHRSA